MLMSNSIIGISIKPCAQFWPLLLFPLFGSLLSFLCLLPPYTPTCKHCVEPGIPGSSRPSVLIRLGLPQFWSHTHGEYKFFLLLLLLLLIFFRCFLFVMRLWILWAGCTGERCILPPCPACSNSLLTFSVACHRGLEPEPWPLPLTATSNYL